MMCFFISAVKVQETGGVLDIFLLRDVGTRRWLMNECDTNLSWMLHFFLTHTVIMLNYNVFLFFIFVCFIFKGSRKEGLCVCLCIAILYTGFHFVRFYSDQRLVHLQKLIYAPLVNLLNEKSLTELSVVYLLIRFKDILSARQCARQRSLCVYRDVVMSHWGLSRGFYSSSTVCYSWGLLSVFSSHSHSENPALEMGQLCLFKSPDRLVLVCSFVALPIRVIVCSTLEHMRMFASYQFVVVFILLTVWPCSQWYKLCPKMSSNVLFTLSW